MWCGVVWCGVVWCGVVCVVCVVCVVWCGVVWCGVVWCGVVWCGVVWCGMKVEKIDTKIVIEVVFFVMMLPSLSPAFVIMLSSFYCFIDFFFII